MSKKLIETLERDSDLMKKYNKAIDYIYKTRIKEDFDFSNLSRNIIKSLGYELYRETFDAVEKRILKEWNEGQEAWIPETYEFVHELEKTIKQASK